MILPKPPRKILASSQVLAGCPPRPWHVLRVAGVQTRTCRSCSFTTGSVKNPPVPTSPNSDCFVFCCFHFSSSSLLARDAARGFCLAVYYVLLAQTAICPLLFILLTPRQSFLPWIQNDDAIVPSFDADHATFATTGIFAHCRTTVLIRSPSIRISRRHAFQDTITTILFFSN